MVYREGVGVIQTFAQKNYKLLSLAVAGLFVTTIAITNAVAGAVVVPINGCDFDDDGAGTWTLQADCVTTAQIDVPANTTVEGDGHTVSAGFTKTSNSNNAVFGVIGADNVTIQNMTIDGSGGTDLHLINTYESSNVVVTNVVLVDSNRTGIVVNGSDVTVSDVSTENSGWHGFNVDQGSGVTDPSVLNIVGPTNQANDLLDIYVDDTSEDVTVNDFLSQYTSSDNVFKPGDRAYEWADVFAPEVEITSPSNGDVLSGVVTVEGTISDDDNVRHRLLVRNSDGDVVYSEIVIDNSDEVAASISFDSAAHPDGEYRLVLVGIDGSGNRGRDAVVVTFDNFVDNKDGCKNGGWEAGVLGGSFRNQGDCVSYFATGGENPPSNGNGNERGNRNR